MAGRNFRYTRYKDWTLAADADFALIGTLQAKPKPEGPFGDHLGYYSLIHDFPCLELRPFFIEKMRYGPLRWSVVLRKKTPRSER